MQKLFLSFMIFGLITSGCRTAKQTQRVVSDSALAQSPAAKLKPVDSTELQKQQLATLLNTPLDFTTFYGRAKAGLNSPGFSGDATVYIKMKKDSIIWISVTGPLNIEGVRVLISRDSVKIMNKLERSVQLLSIANLQRVTKIPLQFSDFQNIILGKPALENNANASYTIKQDSITVSAAGNALKYIYAFAKNSLRLGQSSFQTVDNTSVTGANIFYSDYKTVNGYDFSTGRNIAVSGTAPIKLQLDFREYNFNQPQDYVFTISKNYTIKYQ